MNWTSMAQVDQLSSGAIEAMHGGSRELFQECWRSSLFCICMLTFLGNSGRGKLQKFNRTSGIPVKCYFLSWGLLELKELCYVPLTLAEKDKWLQEGSLAFIVVRSESGFPQGLSNSVLSPIGSCSLACTVLVPVPIRSINQLILGSCGEQIFALQLKQAWRVQWVLEPKWRRGRAALRGRCKVVSSGNSYLIFRAAPKQHCKLHSQKLVMQNWG